jgi:hypothetical protein
MWYKFSKNVFSASAQITKFLSPLPVPEVIEKAPSNIQLELAYCYIIAENRDSAEIKLALNHLSEKMFELKQRNVITTKVSKKSLEISSSFDEVDFDDFEAIVEHIDYLDSQLKPKKDMAATLDMNPVIANGKIKVYNPKTYEESEKVCVGTSWCIGDRSTGMFLNYRYNNESNFYVVEDPNRKYPFRKVAIDVRPNEIEITDEINDTGFTLKAELIVDGKSYGKSIKGYFKYLSDISNGEIKEEDFTPRPLSPEEQETKLKFADENKSLSWFMDLSYMDKEAYILRRYDLSFAQFMFMYERKNVFRELLNLVATQRQDERIQRVIEKDPILYRTKLRSDLLSVVNIGLDENNFDTIVQYKLFTVLDRYIQNFIGNVPKISLSYAQSNQEFKDYMKKFLSEKIFTTEFAFDLRFFELFTIDELQSLVPTMSEMCKSSFDSITNVDGIIDSFANQEIDFDLFEKAIIDQMDVLEAIKKTQETILSKKYKITKPFYLTKDVLTMEFVTECLKNNLISVEILTGNQSSGENVSGVYGFGQDIEFDERFNHTGTVVAAMSDDSYDSYNYDLAFELIAIGMQTGAYNLQSIPREIQQSTGELGVEGLFEIVVNRSNNISDIPSNLLSDDDFVRLLMKSNKFTREYLENISEEQKNALADAAVGIINSKYEKQFLIKDIANAKLESKLKKLNPSLFTTPSTSARPATLPANSSQKMTRGRAMIALGLKPGDKYHEKEADALNISSEITKVQFDAIKKKFDADRAGASAEDYVDFKYMYEDDDSDDDDFDIY